MTIVWLNGRLVAEEEARISPFDRGFLLGDGVFETMRAYDGRVHGLDDHLSRLRASCAAIRLPFPAGLSRAVSDVLHANDLTDGAVRITLTRGPGGRGASPEGAGPPTTLITAMPIHHRPEVYERGIRLATAERRRVPHRSLPASIKSTNYLVHILARIEAEESGADDALFLDEEGHVVEATQANVFAVLGARLVTPPLSSGCLPGLTRVELLALAPSVGLLAEERVLTLEDLHAANEVLLSASLLEVASVVALDGRAIGGGRPGPIAGTLRSAYQAAARHKST